MRHALIDPQNKRVVNVIVWDIRNWQPPRGHIVYKSDTANVGDLWDPVNNIILPVQPENREKLPSLGETI